MNLNRKVRKILLILLIVGFILVVSALRFIKNNKQGQNVCVPNNYNINDQVKVIDYSSKTNKIAAILGCAVFIYDIDKKLSSKVLYENGRLYNFVAFSPDGLKFVLFDKKNGDLLIAKFNPQPKFIYKINFSNPDGVRDMQWAPDGEKIAYIYGDKVYVYNPLLSKNDYIIKLGISKNKIIQPRIKWENNDEIIVLSEDIPQAEDIYTIATLGIVNVNNKFNSEIFKISINNTYFQKQVFDVINNLLVFYSSKENGSRGNSSIQEIHIKDIARNTDRVIIPPKDLREITGIKWLKEKLMVDLAFHLEAGGTSLFNPNNYSVEEIHTRGMGIKDNRVSVWTQSVLMDEETVVYSVYENGELNIYKGSIGLNNNILLTSFDVKP